MRFNLDIMPTLRSSPNLIVTPRKIINWVQCLNRNRAFTQTSRQMELSSCGESTMSKLCLRERRIYCHSRFDLCLCSFDHLDHDAYIVIADSIFIYCNSRFLAVKAALRYKLNPHLCSLGHLKNDAYFVIATYSIYCHNSFESLITTGLSALKSKLNSRLCCLGHLENDAYIVIPVVEHL